MKNGKNLLLAHDLGTSGNKATLFSTEGELIASTISSYETNYFNNNWAEQNPEDWWRAVCDSTRSLIGSIDPAEIAAICFSGQMMGCVCVDKNNNSLRNAILYCDQRSEKEARSILERIDSTEFYKITGHRASSVYSIEKLMWVKNNEPDLYRETRKMLNAKDFINAKFTGQLVTDYSDASGTNAFDLKELAWSDKILDIAGIDIDRFPEPVPSTTVIGELSREAAEQTGLKAGTPVVAGAGDGLSASVGVGSVKPGITYNYIGSSSWIAVTTEEPVFDDQKRTFVWAHAVPGYYLPCGTMQTAGSSYNWLKNVICLAETKEAQEKGLDPFELINQKIAKSPPGSRGVIFLPYMLGERSPRWNPNARGGFIGLNLEHKREDMLRSVVEGIFLNLNVILEIIKKDFSIDEMTVIGGGAKGDVWREIMADIYNVTIVKPNVLEEATSMGAAIIGGIGVEVFKDFDVIDRFIRIDAVRKPNTSNVKIYEKIKPLFDQCYYALTDVFETMAGLQF